MYYTELVRNLYIEKHGYSKALENMDVAVKRFLEINNDTEGLRDHCCAAIYMLDMTDEPTNPDIHQNIYEIVDEIDSLAIGVFNSAECVIKVLESTRAGIAHMMSSIFYSIMKSLKDSHEAEYYDFNFAELSEYVLRTYA